MPHGRTHRRRREPGANGEDQFRVVVIGASAGGITPLLEIVRSLRRDLNSALFVVIHTPASSVSQLSELLDRAGPLVAVWAEEAAPVEPGRIYVAQPDYHLTLVDGHIELNHGPRENGFRPAVDPLFRSAAAAYGPRVVGIVLSGGMNDGTHGLLDIKRAGGLTVAQQPEEALSPGMPRSAIRHVSPNYVLPAVDIAPLINRIDLEPIPRPVRPPRRKASPGISGGQASESSPGAKTAAPGTVPAGDPTALTCPECGGTLWEQRRGDFARYECRVGHAFTDRAFSKAQAGRLEMALWTAARMLEESAAYLQRLANRARDSRLTAVAERYEALAIDAEQRAALILNVLSRPAPPRARRRRAPATPPAPPGRAWPAGRSPPRQRVSPKAAAEPGRTSANPRQRNARGRQGKGKPIG